MSEAGPEALDLVLSGGTVIDGTATAQPHVADVGIRGDTIVAIGDLGERPATRLVDVAGLVVAPSLVVVSCEIRMNPLANHFSHTGRKKDLASPIIQS